ncbi:Zinc finger protein [Oopsacas minuta]|uniref:Zinc finger protein n=1 Tax=Oopsacas minuta TaxID=111878 RepID=A0AAV7KA65_9METZ|nr:Zinc finger protein [Oopsacas minuta]
MGRYAKKKVHKINKSIRKKAKTKRRPRDLDQIVEDLMPQRAKQLLNPKVDVQLPGLGQNLCLHCSRYFIDDSSLQHHFKSKVHKKRVKRLREPVYTHQESESAGGLGVYKPLTKPLIHTVLQPASNKQDVAVDIQTLSISK